VGILRVEARADGTEPIWSESTFPIRFKVHPEIVLDPEYGVPLDKLEGRVSFFRGDRDRGKYQGLLRRSPNPIDEQDARVIIDALQNARDHPSHSPVDARQLARKPFYQARRRQGATTVPTTVTVPEADAEEASEREESPAARTQHTEVQYRLLKLGRDIGLTVWVARNDRNKVWSGQSLGAVPGVIEDLPTQFNEATQRTIELIDVLWLRGNSIVAAFEVESTTAIYSGLLRMSDLLALQPNLNIDLYLAAPDHKRAKVKQEILRPTFALRERPLAEACSFLSFKVLIKKLDGVEKLGVVGSLRPDFIQSIAERFRTSPVG
jgi:hypothetical protein